MQRMFRRTTSQRDSPVVEDYNLAASGRRGMTQPRIDTGSWTQKGKNAKEAIGKTWLCGGAAGGARGVRFTGIHCTYKYTHISDYEY